MYIAGIAGRRQKLWLEATQRRISNTANALKNLKAVKMTGLAGIVSKTMADFRDAEIKSSNMYRGLLIVVVALCKKKHFIFSIFLDAVCY